MLPLILMALGLGVALTAYEFFPGFHGRVDDYVRAIRAAHAAHDAADTHLVSASVAVTDATRHVQAADAVRKSAAQPTSSNAIASTVADMHDAAGQTAAVTGVDHVVDAQAANQEAAKHTGVAAKNAKTAEERREVTDSAVKVLEREKKIAQALVNFGVGQCGVRTYEGVTSQITSQLLSRLHGEGMTVVGDNPWNIDTHQYDVKLRAVWDPKGQVLKLIVMSGAGGYGGFVTCEEIWKKIDPIMKSSGAEGGRG